MSSLLTNHSLDVRRALGIGAANVGEGLVKGRDWFRWLMKLVKLMDNCRFHYISNAALRYNAPYDVSDSKHVSSRRST